MWIHLLILELIDGATGVSEPQPEPETPVTTPAGSFPQRRLYKPTEKPEIAHGTVEITGLATVLVIGHKAVEYPLDKDVMELLGLV